MRIGLALSGGGFRATLYHLGVIRFLRDSDLLSQVSHVTSVSGGSVLGAHLVMNWDRYCGSAEEFDAAAEEILAFVSLDVRNRIMRRYPWLLGLGLWRRISLRRSSRLLTRTGLLERYYQKHLFGNLCLHQLPGTPELHILCTNVSEGGLTSFTRDGLLIQKRLPDGNMEVEHHRAGLARIATAVAASSAFPAFFPPLELRAADVGAGEGEFPTQYFTDGGIFDNLGVRMFHYLSDEMAASASADTSDSSEGVCDVILASDVGRIFSVYGPDRTPGFLATALRSSDILMNRVWQLERAYLASDQKCLIAASSDTVPQESDPTALHPEIQIQVSRIRTDMDRFREIEIGGLVRHGYCVARHACRSLPAPTAEQISEEAPWDPTETTTRKNANEATTPSGRYFGDVTTAARILQRSTSRRLWSPLLDLRDWVTWIYIPLILLILGALPLLTYRMYRHAQLNATLTHAVTEMREDFSRMLDLLEHGPPVEIEAMEVQETNILGPRLAEEGLDIISDNRITDLRDWLQPPMDAPQRVYVYRHVMVRKTSESTGIPGLRLQSLWDSPELSVCCENTELQPVLRRCKQSAAGDKNTGYAWEILLDFSNVPIGETIELVVEIMLKASSGDDRFATKEWWRFEVDADPEVATSWVLLPETAPHDTFNVVRYRKEIPAVIELVKPTHQTRLYGGSVINWSVVHPEPDYTYSSRWSEEDR
jgi:predicted acylesterase/phospholipase RssA